MNLHEYQAKKLFAEFGIPVPPGRPAHSISEALANASSVKGHGWVVKAQVHAGGRGKAGGVRIANDLEELESIVRDLLGSRLVTKQSGPEGKPVNCVLIEATTEIRRELYLALTVDRTSRKVAIMASTEGGMDIEEVAARDPGKIHTVTIDPLLGLQGFQCRRLAKGLELEGELEQELTHILQALHRLFMEKDLSLVEVNPLVVNGEGHLQALDAKINIDDNALYRQDDLAEWHDPTQDDPREATARRFDLNYVALDGDIGCMVNGAGLAMATMDIIKLHGGRPANFLDVGGGATADRVAEAFKIIVDTPELKAILVNIFGGIVRCDLIADGVVTAIREVGVTVPVVVRLEGTNVEQGLKIIADSGLDIIPAGDLNEAAIRVVAAARGEQP